jgi:lysyl-tRNA synthetase class 2
MKPEKTVAKDSPDKFMALGIPEEWVPVVQKAGILIFAIAYSLITLNLRM